MITLKHKRGVQDTYHGYTVPAHAYVRVAESDLKAMLDTGQFERVQEDKPKATAKSSPTIPKQEVKQDG